MARIISGPTGRDIYVEVLEDLRRRGYRRDSRNGLTYALDDVTLDLESPLYALPVDVGRKLSLKIAAAEALQLIGGFSDPEWLVKLAPAFQRYREPSGKFWGAYGTRVGDQIRHVRDKLRDDPWTRQAIITLWDPSLDNDPGRSDYPCTVAIGFARGVSRSVLNMRVVMRSNDAWLGLPYDMFQFAQLQLTLCNMLDLFPGTYTHTAWNMHLYQANLDESYGVGEPERGFTPDYPRGVGRTNERWDAVGERCRAIAYAELNQETIPEITEGERWFYDALHKG